MEKIALQINFTKITLEFELPNASSDNDCRGSQKIFDKFKHYKFMRDKHDSSQPFPKFNHQFQSSPECSQVSQMDYFQDVKSIWEGDQHSGTVLLDCKFLWEIINKIQC